MGKFILGVLFTVVVLAIGIYCYFALGIAPVATAAQAMPFEKKLANLGLHKRIEKEMPKNPPNIQMDDAAYQSAANLYKDQCAFCHGLPNQKKPPAATGMYPRPPQLFSGHGVTDDEPGETYWRVANGIRLTGMPAYKPSMPDEQIWQVTFLLKNADKLPASAQQILGGQIVAGQSGDHDHHEH
jgi:mono/diheme cytochrome c family protein